MALCLTPAQLVAQGKGEDKVHLIPQPCELQQVLVSLDFPAPPPPPIH